MCTNPIEEPCPWPECEGMIRYDADTCPVCGQPVEWVLKDPNRPGGYKPIRPGGS